MNLGLIINLLDRERRSGVLDGNLAEALPFVTRTHAADRSWHMVSYSALTEENAAEQIAAEVRYFRDQTGTVEWKVYAHDRPADLTRRLEEQGFDVGAREAVLVLDLNAPPDWVSQHPTHRVARVESAEHVELFRRIAEQVFGRDWSSTANELLAAIRAASTDHRGYIAFDGEVPAAVGRLYTRRNSQFGGLYGGGTLTAHRKRRMYRALVAARAVDAVQLGARYLLVDALPTSRPILESLGFLHLTDTWPCTLQREISGG